MGASRRSDASAPPAVALLHWPRDAVRRDALAAAGVPRLLLVAADTAPPHVRELEDWIRVPADERDLLLRMHRLERQCRRAAASAPELTDQVLRTDSATVILSPQQALLVERLAADFERVVSRADLVKHVWGDEPQQPGALKSIVRRCRVRLEGTGLTIASVRDRGFTLAWRADDDG